MKIRDLFARALGMATTSRLDDLEYDLLQKERELMDLQEQNAYLIQQNQELHKEYKSLESDLSRAMERVVVLESYKKENELLKDRIQHLSKAPAEVYVMGNEQYTRMEKALEAGIVTKDTSPQQTGYLLGIQRALAYLRQHHVVR